MFVNRHKKRLRRISVYKESTVLHTNPLVYNRINQLNNSSRNDRLLCSQNRTNQFDESCQTKNINDEGQSTAVNSSDNNQTSDVQSIHFELPNDTGAVNGDHSIEFSPEIVTEEQVDQPSKFNLDWEQTFKKCFKYLFSWSRLFAQLALYGKTRFSKEQYELMAAAINSINNNDVPLPAYKTVKGKQHEYFLDKCLPFNEVYHLETMSHGQTSSSVTKLIETRENVQEDVRNCIRLVTPSSWAKFDISLYHLYSEMYEKQSSQKSNAMSFENTNIMTNRSTAVGSVLSFWGSYNGSIVHCHYGSLVNIPCNLMNNQKNVPQGWEFHNTISAEHNNSINIKASIGHQWCVGSAEGSNPRSIKTSINNLSTSAENLIYQILKISTQSVDEAFTNINTTAVHTNDQQIVNESDKLQPSEQQGKKLKEGNYNSSIVHGSAEFRKGNRQLRGLGRKTQGQTVRQFSPTNVRLYPSDICTFLRPTGSLPAGDEVVCLFVASIVSAASGSIAEKIIWIRYHSDDHRSMNNVNNNGNLEVLLVLKVLDVPHILDSELVGNSEYVPPIGKLENGERYVIYRAAFYADEFKERRSMSNTRNVCGCYLRPFGFSDNINRSSCSIRVLTLTPYGHDSNKALMIIINDIVNTAVNGVDGIDPFGNKVKIFVDVPIFFGDYVKIPAVTDSLSHSANCFCGYCSIQKDAVSIGPRYIHTTIAHSRRLGFMKCEFRNNILRNLQLHSDVKKSLGMKSVSITEALSLPLVSLSQQLTENLDNVKSTSLGMPVLQPFFDSYQSTAVAPDHLLSGLAADVLKCCFEFIDDYDERLLVESKILSAAASNGLQLEGFFLIHDFSKFKGIKTMSMSSLYIILMMSSPIFFKLSQDSEVVPNPYLLPSKLYSYIALFYFWPQEQYDTDQEITLVHSNRRTQYHSLLSSKAKDYTNAAASFLKDCSRTMKYKPDKPNGHRLIELTVHTVPLLGHGIFFSEMIFELVHFFFKKWLEDNRSPDSHITAVEVALCRAWSLNVYTSLIMWRNEQGAKKLYARNSIRRLFLGEHSNELSYKNGQTAGYVKTFDDGIINLFRKPLPTMLKQGLQIPLSNTSYDWKESGRKAPLENCYITESGFKTFNDNNLGSNNIQDSCSFFSKASLYSKQEYETEMKTYPYRTISKSSVVSIILSPADYDNKIITTRSSPAGSRLYIIVHTLFKKMEKLYVIGPTMCADGELYKCNEHDVRVLELNNTVTRVATIHSCNKDCIMSYNRSIVHSDDIFSGGNFFILSRKDGYPPHLG